MYQIIPFRKSATTILDLQHVAWLLGWVIVACLWPYCCCCCHCRLAHSLVLFQLATDSCCMSLWSLIGSSQLTCCTGLAWPGPLKLDNKPCLCSSSYAEPCPVSLPLIWADSMLEECLWVCNPINLEAKYSNWGAANLFLNRSVICWVLSSFCTFISSHRCSLKKWYFTAMCLVWKLTLLVASANWLWWHMMLMQLEWIKWMSFNGENEGQFRLKSWWGDFVARKAWIISVAGAYCR